MKHSELKEILKLHELWSLGAEGGRKAGLIDANLSNANLSNAHLIGADLSCTNLSGADLRYANLRHVNLYKANLSNADLYNADLYGSSLCDADLRYANLYDVDLRYANLRHANLYKANLSNADLYNADLYNANLRDIHVNLHTVGYFALCPEGGFTAYKKCRDDVIVKLFIPAKAKRSNATTRKCRADSVRVLDIFGAEHGVSIYDSNFIYKKGDLLTVEDFDENRWNESSTGIHFFLNKEEAELYT